jgi:hypothetical protein
LFLTGFWPIQVKRIKSATKIQKQILKIGLKVVFLISEVFVKGISSSIKIAPIIAIIPPTLDGMDLKIA